MANTEKRGHLRLVDPSEDAAADEWLGDLVEGALALMDQEFVDKYRQLSAKLALLKDGDDSEAYDAVLEEFKAHMDNEQYQQAVLKTQLGAWKAPFFPGLG